MARKYLSVAMLFVVAGLTGCTQTAREIKADGTSITVAIPENTNVWPTYYQDAAHAKIREKFPNFNPQLEGRMVKVEEVVVGQEQRTEQRTEQRSDRRQVGPDGKPKGEITTNTNVTTTSDKKEVWLTYELGGGKMSNTVTPVGGMQMQNNTGMPTGNMGMQMNNTGMPVNTGNGMPMNNTVVPAHGQSMQKPFNQQTPVNPFPTGNQYGPTGPGSTGFNGR